MNDLKILMNRCKESDSSIILVWIASHVKILKGCKIPDDCVVAAGSVVSSVFEEKNCLIAGNPARIIRRGVEWK